jgi:hypothetical protein
VAPAAFIVSLVGAFKDERKAFATAGMIISGAVLALFLGAFLLSFLRFAWSA